MDSRATSLEFPDREYVAGVYFCCMGNNKRWVIVNGGSSKLCVRIRYPLVNVRNASMEKGQGYPPADLPHGGHGVPYR